MECKSLAWDLERIRRRKEVRLRSSRRRSAADTGIWTRHPSMRQKLMWERQLLKVGSGGRNFSLS